MLLGIEMLQVSASVLVLPAAAGVSTLSRVFSQTPIINALLEKIPEFMLDRSVIQQLHNIPVGFFFFFPPSSMFTPPLSAADGGISVPRIIVNHLKWLDRVVDSKVVISESLLPAETAP